MNKTEIKACIIGDCRNETIINEIFGSVTDFAQTIEQNGNEFKIGWLMVTYDNETDIHTFYRVY
tara:strand:+ start:322 stop:513 length:192 start_codon:yes stop_codon:yes gene_type:complete